MSPRPGRGGWDRAAHARLDGWIALAERGWRLFPVRPASKVPSISQWSQRATSDPDRLSRFFRAHPTHNAGIACGPSGLVVVDCDVAKPDQPMTRWRDGAAVFDDLAALHGGTPATWTVRTPSGGQHRYYSAPTDRVLGNTSRVLGPLVDTRGDGGQVLAQGSVLPAGGYELLDDTDPAPLPAWLTNRLTPPSPTPPAPVTDVAAGWALSSRHAAYVASAVAAETERVRQAGRGGHNTAVFTAANALGQLVGAGALDRAEAEAAITVAAEHICTGPCDCTPREVAASIRSGLDRGTRNPRRLPDRAASTPATPTRTHSAGGDPMTPHDHHPADHNRPDDAQTTPATTPEPSPLVPPRPALTPEQALTVASASWAIAARDAAIDDGDAVAAARLDGVVLGAVNEAGAAGITQHRLAIELDYPGGPAAMLDPPELGDPDFRPRQDLAFDPTLAATTPEEAMQWLTARTGDSLAAELILTGYQDAVIEADPTSDGWVGSLSPHELEYLTQGGARPGETFDDALRRIEQTEPEDLIPVDLDTPIPYQLTDPTSLPAPEHEVEDARLARMGEPEGVTRDAGAERDADREFDELTAQRPLPGEGPGTWVSNGPGSYLWVDEDEIAAEAEPPTAADERPTAPRVIAAEATGHAAASIAADVPGDVARWAPVGEAEQIFTAREAAQRLGEEGFTDAAAAAAVTAYLDDVRRDTSVTTQWWGLDAHDLAAIARAARASQDVAATLDDSEAATGVDLAPDAVPAPRLDAEEARRHELNRWHAADSAADSSEAGAVDEFDDGAVRS